jgi:hypothetical protein
MVSVRVARMQRSGNSYLPVARRPWTISRPRRRSAGAFFIGPRSCWHGDFGLLSYLAFKPARYSALSQFSL